MISYRKLDAAYVCDGMCFDTQRVISDLFTLIGAYDLTGISMGAEEGNDTIYIKEVARTISTVSLHCRQQMSSYASEAYREASATSASDKESYYRSTYPAASTALNSSIGSYICDKDNKLKPLSFYNAIGKFCHVEEWSYPINFKCIIDEDGYATPDRAGHLILAKEDEEEASQCNDICYNGLEVKITKQGRNKNKEMIVPASNNYEICRINIPYFVDAARIFITECATCQLVEIDDSLSQECE